MVRTVLLSLLVLPQGAFAGYAASSFKKETKRGANYWNAASALDGDLATCWRIDPEADNKNQWLELDVPKGHVDKMGAVIGWDKDDNTFFDYARIKTARIDVFDLAKSDSEPVLQHEVKFEDKRGWQVVEVPDTKVGDDIYGGRVRLTVLDFYPGKDFPSLAVSEILAYLKEFPVETMVMSGPPANAEAGHEASKMEDGNARTFWASGGGDGDDVFSVEANGYGLSSIGITTGPKTHKRPQKIEVTASDATIVHVLEDKPSTEHWVRIPAMVGYTGSAWGQVTVKVINTYDGTDESKGVAIAEVKLRATNIDDI